MTQTQYQKNRRAAALPRWAAAAKLKDKGLTYEEIGVKLSVTTRRAWLMVQNHHEFRMFGTVSR